MTDTQRIGRLEERVDKQDEDRRETQGKIFDKLEVISKQVTETHTEMTQWQKSTDAIVDAHSTAIHGNTKPGLVTKVDRLEQTEKLRNWIIGGLVLAAIGGAATLIVEVISRKM